MQRKTERTTRKCNEREAHVECVRLARFEDLTSELEELRDEAEENLEDPFEEFFEEVEDGVTYWASFFLRADLFSGHVPTLELKLSLSNCPSNETQVFWRKKITLEQRLGPTPRPHA